MDLRAGLDGQEKCCPYRGSILRPFSHKLVATPTDLSRLPLRNPKENNEYVRIANLRAGFLTCDVRKTKCYSLDFNAGYSMVSLYTSRLSAKNQSSTHSLNLRKKKVEIKA